MARTIMVNARKPRVPVADVAAWTMEPGTALGTRTPLARREEAVLQLATVAARPDTS